ncbi:MAG: hypothetical protein R6V72_07945 [Cyclobacterium sp.]|uniref:hypothetical protein n=1 Tax=unclassified Cyclobacterium TaxID=2615055 RepID=UPI0013D0BB16|nr:hypothetical protein [Cyclobacterium sp. SYSU L10401]
MLKNLKYYILLTAMCVLNQYHAYGQENKEYHHRIGTNILGLAADNLVFSYEYSYQKSGFWLGIAHRVNQWSEAEDQSASSIAFAYRNYFLPGETPGSGFFGELYSKYGWGEENTITGSPINHQYQALYAGLATGYRYNFRRWALSAFIGYGWALWSHDTTSPVGAEHELNQDYKKDLRLGLNVEWAF